MYGCSIDGMDKMCNGHPRCTTKQLLSIIFLESHPSDSFVLVTSSAQMTTMITCITIEMFATIVNGMDQLLILEKSRLNV